MEKRRTKIDWSKHELSIVENDYVKIHHLKVPGSSMDNVKFINAGGILAVTGDYGNWIFCREFVPGPKEYVSGQYWKEKLKIASTQESDEFDSESTREEIQKMLDSDDWNKDEKKELQEMYEKADTNDSREYLQFAYHETSIDWEYIPNHKKTKYWLLAVFDAFEEICKRLKN